MSVCYYQIILCEIEIREMDSNDMAYILGACDFALDSGCIIAEERSQLLSLVVQKYNRYTKLSEV